MLESEIYDWLQQAGINTPKYRLLKINDTPDADFFPVALKIQSPKVVHKSDVGGVVTDIKNRSELADARNKILANLAQHGITTDDNDRLIITEMCKGIELFFGVITDPVFGKVIVFGTGGVFVELFKDVCFIDSEAGDEEIQNAILQTKISKLFTTGFRGNKYDIALVTDMVKKLQQLEVSELDFNPVLLTQNKLTVVDARVKFDKPAVQKRLPKFLPGIFEPGNIVIVGASQHAGKVGNALACNAAEHENVMYVNPGIDTLFGKKVYHTISDLPSVDTAVLAIPAAGIKDAIINLIPKGVKHIVIITAGFKEIGQDESFLAALASEHNLNIIGPNCFGVYIDGINLTFGTSDIHSGQVNLFSQSGAILSEMMDKAALENIGFENIISVGNMADIDFADLINSYTGSNPINMYIEGVANGKNLLRAIRKSKVPVSIFKAGRSKAAQKAAFSHTGNLSGNYEMFVGLLKSVGAKVLNDTSALLYPNHFNKVIIVTNAGGPGTVLSDLISDKIYDLSAEQIESLNKVLPYNWSKGDPIDIIGEATHERYLHALQVVDDFGADAVFVIVTPQFMTDIDKIAAVFTDNTFKTKVYPVFLGGELVENAREIFRRKKIIFFEELRQVAAFM